MPIKTSEKRSVKKIGAYYQNVNERPTHTHTKGGQQRRRNLVNYAATHPN